MMNMLKLRLCCFFFVSVFLAVQTVFAQMKLTQNRREDPAKAEFVYTDVENFIRAFQQLKPGIDTVAHMQREYLDKQTPGLRMFIEKYGLTAKNLTAAIGRRPQVYAKIGTILAALRKQEPEYRKAYASLKRMMPDASFPPTFFLVATYRGIASGSIEGTINSIEKETEESVKGDFVATLVHEMTHLQQLRVLEEKYFTIFNEEKTLLALTIREGAAEFIADRVTGGDTFKAPARAFLIAHEQELWKRYKPDMLGSDTKDWMWGHPVNPEQPDDIAYVLGARIVSSYYDNATDKAKAMSEILGVTDYPAFLKKSGYEERIMLPQSVTPYFSALVVNSIDKAIAWYTDVFSLKLYNRAENKERGFKQANMGNGGIFIELVELASSVPRTEVEQNNRRVTGLYKYGFTVSDFDGWYEKLKSKGVEFYGRTVSDVATGKRTFLIKDPDGNTIQFFEG